MKVQKKIEADGTFTYSMTVGDFSTEQTFLYEQDEKKLTEFWREELKKCHKERQDAIKRGESWAKKNNKAKE